MARARILILGGTGEGFRLAAYLHAQPDVDVITSMAGRTPAPKTPAGALRRGGFGGVEGLASYLRAEGIVAMVDATHPFASRMSRNAALASREAGVASVHIHRECWSRGAGDDWREVASLEDAVAELPTGAGTTFLTVGKTQLHHFAGRDDVSFLARIVSPLKGDEDVGDLPSKLTFVHDRGPFDLESERQLLLEHDVAWIVSKNSGGAAAHAKLVAARELDIPVIMIQRPDAPDGMCVVDADAAIHWLSDHVALSLRQPEAVR